MLLRKISTLGLGFLFLGLQVFPLATLNSRVAAAEEASESASESNASTAVPEPLPSIQTFVITAYYSPHQGQEHYVTGSYEGDIRLNGNGTNGADGTEVYPGMIAAPKKYPFGTKMNIPGVGIVAVHDRGGAIVVAGEKGQSFDRLDIWMGYGDLGLKRALSWGKRTVPVTVYGIDESVLEQVYLEGYSEAEQYIQTVIAPSLSFPYDIYFGTEGEEVKKMQDYLKEWGYLTIEPDGFYGSETADAIFLLQLDYQIVASGDELGAGHFGPATRRQFEDLIQNGIDLSVVKLQRGRQLMAQYADLNESPVRFSRALELGDKGEDVSLLQEELRRLGFLRIDPSGYFGEVTVHAVFKFQQSQGLVADEEDLGAGYVGPNTRSALNAIIESRIQMKSLLAYQRQEIESGRLIVQKPNLTLARKEED